jgi:hypothetical protein
MCKKNKIVKLYHNGLFYNIIHISAWPLPMTRSAKQAKKKKQKSVFVICSQPVDGLYC